MNEKEISLADLIKEHETLKMIHQQLFENMQLLLTNEEHQLAKEATVLSNQSIIIHNQDIIVKNQVSIIKNQQQIVSNQSTLNLILTTQAEILNKIRRMEGIEESLEVTSLSIEAKRHSTADGQLNDAEII
jgi:hypothetical protein